MAASLAGSTARGDPCPASPAVAQLAELDEYGARVGRFADVGKRLAQSRDHRRVLQPQERVDAFLLPERGDHRCRRIVVARAAEQLLGVGIAWLAIERELEVARQVLVPGVDASAV